MITFFHKRCRWSILCFALIELSVSLKIRLPTVFLVTAWLVIVEGFDSVQFNGKKISSYLEIAPNILALDLIMITYNQIIMTI